MDDLFAALPASYEAIPGGDGYEPVSGTYAGRNGTKRLELRVDLHQNVGMPYEPLNLISGDIFQGMGGAEWDYRYSFIVEHPYIRWGAEQVFVIGTMNCWRDADSAMQSHDLHTRHILKATLPLSAPGESCAPATVQIVRWGTNRTTYLCERSSPYLRTLELEIDRITGTELPRTVQMHITSQPNQLLSEEQLDITQAYRRAGLDMRIISDDQVFPPTDAGSDLQWDEDELHHAMESHFSHWRDEPQWRLYLLIATHYKLYPNHIVSGIMYDSQYRDPNDPFPRQGVAAFYASIAASCGQVSDFEFDRNYLRTCVHELGHALNLLHCFDQDRQDSASWMNYPWRYPYGYSLPPGWDGTDEFWENFRYEFDMEELRHIRHGALLDVIPGGVAFGTNGYDLPTPTATGPRQQEHDPVALHVRTRPERHLFRFAEPVTVELRLKNQTDAPLVVPDMLNPELGMLELFVRDPRGSLRPYRPLFRLCGVPRTVTLPPGGKLYESTFVGYGADGFYFEEPGEYQLWAVYGAGGMRIRSNVLRIRIGYPQTRDDEEMALWTFGRDQGHILYMRGAEHLRSGQDQLLEVTERFPETGLARYIHYCLGSGQAREFKDVVQGNIRAPRPQDAIRQLERARAFSPRWEKHSALDNIRHGQAANLLSDLYCQTDRADQAKTVLEQTARYFKRMEVKAEVIEDLQTRAAAIAAGRGQDTRR
jgi:hypothetical protein